MDIPLRLGPLKADGYKIHRSGVRWLCEPGQMCQANQIVAYFNLSLEPSGARPKGAVPFSEEREFQVACAPRVGGRLMFDSASAPGGYLSVLGFNLWDADAVLGHMQIDGSPADPDGDTGRLRLLLLAGRRMTPLVDVHTGLLHGWHGRSRGWWSEPGETPVTLLNLGICDVTGVVLGEQSAFQEMFRAETGSRHFVFIPDQPITPSAPVLLDQLDRSESQFRAISADVHTGLSKSSVVPTPNDWLFVGTLLSMMQRSPIRETYDMISGDGLSRGGPAEAVLLSLSAEPQTILRHKTLGYRVHFMRHHHEAAGPAVHAWLAETFEPVRRTPDDIKKGYENLIDAIEKSTGARVIILNRMSTSGDENISSYAPFDAPMSSVLTTIAAKELNLMLHDVVAGRRADIIDIDAIAADIGGGEHLPDGIHQSRVMQEILRQEILHILKDIKARK